MELGVGPTADRDALAGSGALQMLRNTRKHIAHRNKSETNTIKPNKAGSPGVPGCNPVLICACADRVMNFMILPAVNRFSLFSRCKF